MKRGPLGAPRPLGWGPLAKPRNVEGADRVFTQSHSYRNFSPNMFGEILETEIKDRGEIDGRSITRDALRFVESGRWADFLSSLSKFIGKLDTDERELFTRRNPGGVKWMSVRNRIAEQNPYQEFVELADNVLINGDDMVDRDQVPPYERKDIRDDRTLLESLAFRRRSYRNFAPVEIMEVSQRDHTISKGMARDLGIFTPDERDEIEFPIELNGRKIGRAVLERIESGRFEEMLSDCHWFFVHLDSDERIMFHNRNLGLIQWISVWGFTEHQVHGNQLFPHRDIEFPRIRTIDPT